MAVVGKIGAAETAWVSRSSFVGDQRQTSRGRPVALMVPSMRVTHFSKQRKTAMAANTANRFHQRNLLKSSNQMTSKIKPSNAEASVPQARKFRSTSLSDWTAIMSRIASPAIMIGPSQRRRVEGAGVAFQAIPPESRRSMIS